MNIEVYTKLRASFEGQLVYLPIAAQFWNAHGLMRDKRSPW